MSKFKTEDIVYVRRGSYWFQATVDHTYTSATGVPCVSFTSGSNVTEDMVETFEEYWERQRAAREAMV